MKRVPFLINFKRTNTKKNDAWFGAFEIKQNKEGTKWVCCFKLNKARILFPLPLFNLNKTHRAFRSISFFLFTFLQINEVHAWKRWKKRTKGTHGSFTSFLCHFFSFCFFHTVHASFSSLRSFIHYNRVEAKKEKWKEKDMKWIPCL